MKKILLSMLCSVFLLSNCVILYASDISGISLDGLKVQPDIGTEAHMVNAEALAAGEWWKFFAGIAVLTSIVVITSYVKANQNIWAANANGQHGKAEKLKKARHIVAVAWVFIAALALILINIYMKPYSIKREAKAYEELYILNRIYGFETPEEPEISNITLDLVVRRSVFGVDDVFGTAVVDGNRYVISSHSTVEKGDMYSLCSLREGALLPDLGVTIYTTKDFDMFIYHDSYKTSSGDFVGPAESVAEAEEIYAELTKKLRDKFYEK